MHRPPRGTVLAALALTVLVPVVLLAVVRAPVPAPSGKPAGPVPSLAATPTGDPVGMREIEWAYTPPPTLLGGPDATYTLQAGTLADDEPVLDLEIPWRAELGEGFARQPAIGKPHGGSVVYVADDGALSEVRRAEIAAHGRNEALATLEEVIWDIAVVPGGRVAYAAVVNRADTTLDLGVVQVLLDGSGSVEPFLPAAPLEAAGAIRRTAVLSFDVQLAVSSDGRYLVRRTCGEPGCVFQVAELATGRVLDLADREVIGIASGVIVARGCAASCGLEVIDIESGAAVSAGVDVFGPVVEVDENPVVVTVASDGRGAITVDAVNPASGRRSVLYRAPEGAEIATGDLFSVLMDVPDGFVYVIEMTPVGEDGAVIRVHHRHLLISVIEGRAIEIPRPAYRQPPGFGQQG